MRFGFLQKMGMVFVILTPFMEILGRDVEMDRTFMDGVAPTVGHS